MQKDYLIFVPFHAKACSNDVETLDLNVILHQNV